jgi:hypothetical protein
MVKWIVNVRITRRTCVDSHGCHNVVVPNVITVRVITVLVQECWVSVITAGRRAVVEQILCRVVSPDVSEGAMKIPSWALFWPVYAVQ